MVSAYDGGGVGDQVLVRADSPITAIAELRGKSIAVGKGSSAHGHILAQLKKAGIDARGREAGVPAARRRVVGVHAGRGRRVGDLGSLHRAGRRSSCRCAASARPRDVTNGYWFGVASDQALADPKRNTALADLLVRFEKAARWAKDHPQRMGAELRRGRGAGPESGRGVAGRAACGCPTELDDEVVASEQKIADLFAEIRSDRSPAPKFADWVDRRYNDALRPLLIVQQLGADSMPAQVLLVSAHQRRQPLDRRCVARVVASHRARRTTVPRPAATSPRWRAPRTGWATKAC